MIHWFLAGVLAVLSIIHPSACTLYSVSPTFQISFSKSSLELAHAIWDPHNFDKGLSFLHVYTSSKQSLINQHRGAGFLEGYTTFRQIYGAYSNLCKGYFNGVWTLNSKVQNFVEDQWEYIEERIAKAAPNDRYWRMVQAKLQQLRYMYRGYLKRIYEEARGDMHIGFSQFCYLTNVGDLEDLLPALREEKRLRIKEQDVKGNCNGYVRISEDQESLMVAHSTHNLYSFMIRIFKSYNFPGHSDMLGSTTMTFSSRPGDLNSKDDFYVLSSGLKVIETSFNNYKGANYAQITPNGLPCWLRAIVACQLARNGDEWVDLFLRERSGTHNNQWMVIEESKLGADKGVVVFVEEAFSMVQVTDMTTMLNQQGYVASYNVPYNQKIVTKLGYNGQKPYSDDLRAFIFAKYHPLMVDIPSAKKWLIANEEGSPADGLAPRYDLLPNPFLFGLIDCKIVNKETLQQGYIWVQSGPSVSNGRFKPFSWQNFGGATHEYMPSLWNFGWEKFYIDVEKANTVLRSD